MKKSFRRLYWVGLHLLVAALLIHGDYVHRAGVRFGFWKAPRPGDSRYFQMMATCHRRLDGNVPEGAVVFVGDSTVQGLCVAAVAPLSVNYGIAGDTTAGVLQRLPAYESLRRAGAIVLAVGVNDVKSLSNEEILRNWADMADRLPADVPVIFCAVLPLDERVRPNWRGMNQADIRPLNAGLAALVAKRTNRFFADAGPLLVDADGNLVREFHDGDGLHLNSKGNAIWIAELRNVLALAMRSGSAPALRPDGPPR